MKIAILTANLGNFDNPVDPVKQVMSDGYEVLFHRFTDDNFPPITGLTPRLQYRLPKLFGYEMSPYPDSDIFIWLDGSMSLQDEFSVACLVYQLQENDIAFFKHPWRKTIKEEVDHVEEYLQRGKEYIVSRYKNGLHKEMYEFIKQDEDYNDNLLLASTAFIYRNKPGVYDLMDAWWFYQSRFYTVDQIALTYVAKIAHTEKRVNVKVIDEDIFHCPYISLVSKHK